MWIPLYRKSVTASVYATPEKEMTCKPTTLQSSAAMAIPVDALYGLDREGVERLEKHTWTTELKVMSLNVFKGTLLEAALRDTTRARQLSRDLDAQGA